MQGLGSSLLPLDSEIEKTTQANRRATREAQTIRGELEEIKTPISLDIERDHQEQTMAEPQRPTLGDYYKRTDSRQISMVFQPITPFTFDIKIMCFQV